MSWKIKLFGLLLNLFLVACGGDSGLNTKENSSSESDSFDASGNANSAPLSVKIYRYDQSVQCEQGGVGVDTMQNELVDAGIDVLCAQTGHDGLAYISMCGAPTGRINIFAIHQANLQHAIELGFKPVSELEHYQDVACIP